MIGGGYLTEGALFAERYRITGELGRGGVSVVYAARDTQVEQDVAVKLLVPSPAAANQTRERMRREVNAVRRLTHAGIVAVYDFVEDGPYGAVIMELVHGEDLDRRIRRIGPLPADEVERIGQAVASALAAAHARGILHRDVKPKNILLAPDGGARLTDFGSARMDGDATITRTGAIVGTLAYMAPETAAGHRPDARADVFALGMTLYHAAAGRLPDRPSPHLPTPPSPTGYTPIVMRPDLPLWLAHVIARATTADPGDRYPTPTAFADALSNREVRADAALDALQRNHCVLCGALDVLGADLCPSCAGGSTAADSWVLLQPPRSITEREALLGAAASLLGPDIEAETLSAVTAGSRALMKVPAAAEPRVIDALGRRGLRARVVADRDLWRALPPGFQLLVGTVVASGIVAGIVADGTMAVASFPLAALLVLGGIVSIRRPALNATRRPSALSRETQARIVATFAELPDGVARALLADVVRRGQAVNRALRMRQDSSGVSANVDDLVAVACASARDLASLDESLAVFGREAPADDAAAIWTDSLAQCEQARDSAIQRLLDAVTVLGQLDTESIRGVEESGARLGELVAEIASEVRARGAAREEIASLLAR